MSHGSEGSVTLGSTVLDGGNLADYADALAQIGDALAPGGDLMLYGCDVADGAAGQQFIDALAELTGANVAASTDATGAAALGGDWTLEASTGPIEAERAVHDRRAGKFRRRARQRDLHGQPDDRSCRPARRRCRSATA